MHNDILYRQQIMASLMYVAIYPKVNVTVKNKYCATITVVY